MTDQNTPGGDQTPGPQQPPRRGSMRHQDASSTTPREPTLAEQRARRKAEEDQRRQEIADQEARSAAERKAATKRKVLIGSGVTVGVVGLVAAWYAAVPEEVQAVCTDANENVVDDKYCDDTYANSNGGHISGGFIFLGGTSYRYNYGGSGAVGSKVSGGSFDKPSGRTSVSTKSGKTVQRGGFGINNSGTGKSGGS